MAKCRECKYFDYTQSTSGGLHVCTNTKRRRHYKWGGYKTFGNLRAPSAKACKSGFEPRKAGIEEI